MRATLLRRSIVASIVAFALFGAHGPDARAGALALFHDERPAMGTTFEIYLYASDEERANELFDASFDEIERVEAVFSNYRPSSELSRINANAAGGPVVTDPEVFDLVARSMAFSRESDGAFDITVGPLMKAWGFFKGRGSFPSEAELARAKAETGFRRVRLDAASRSIRFDGAASLDVGGIGKGYAIDCVATLLREEGVTSALVGSGSSSIYALGAPPGKTGWTVTVSDPLDRSVTLSTVELADASISTSGNYEKFFRLDGRTYCHIMDPRTGRPVEGVVQTSVIAPTATDSDALSTTVFVLGPARAASVLRCHAGTSALVVTDRHVAARVVRIGWPEDR